jgi:hypothetical protein
MTKAEKHPGPFSGPDAELARACAVLAVLDYGNETGVQFDKIKAGNIWNDHVAVQSALAAIHSLRLGRDDSDAASFDRGVTHAIELLVAVLGVTAYDVADGSEEYDTDVKQTMMNIMMARKLYNEDDGTWAKLVSRDAIRNELNELMYGAENFFGAINPKRDGHIHCALDRIMALLGETP